MPRLGFRGVAIACTLLLFLVGGCEDDKAPAPARTDAAAPAGTAPEKPAMQQSSPSAGKPSQDVRPRTMADYEAEWASGVYSLVTPEPALSGTESGRAQLLVDFANAATTFAFESSCGRYPERVMTLVRRYRESFDAPAMQAVPARGCAAQGAPGVPEGVEESARTSMAKALSDMDAAIVRMRGLWQSLHDYVADTSIVDEGAKGQELVDELDAAWTAYAGARKSYLSVADAVAGDAQERLLSSHVLRGQVYVAERIFHGLREAADIIVAQEPDGKILKGVLDRMEVMLAAGENLPFPIPGETEMHYRGFVREARGAVALLRTGFDSKSFTADLRSELNERWKKAGMNYDAFIEAAARAKPRALQLEVRP